MLQRIKIVASIKNGKKEKNHHNFYGKYANVVSKCLKKPVFLKFLYGLLNGEKIQKKQVKNVQIRMFPLIKNDGNYLIGKCNTHGEIFLYPKRLGICRKKINTMKPESFIRYVEGRARASLIHELLHLKYERDENTVKQLTKKYFTIFGRNQNSKLSDITKYNKMIFNY